jgi:hypothetical protein
MAATNPGLYVSATPAEFEIQNSIVGNKGYFPTQAARIGAEELVPFVLPGEEHPTFNVQRSTFKAESQISRTDQSPDEFDGPHPWHAARR